MEQNALGVPTVSISVSFIPLWQTEEYKDIAPLERVELCDIVSVGYEKLGVFAKAKVTKTVYDVLLGRYDKIELGAARTTLEKTLADQKKEIEEKQSASTSMLQQAILHATKLITGASGGCVILHQDGNGMPYEILIMDQPDIDTAANVWRFNQNGWGHSSNGYRGPYEMAATMDNGFVADYIKTGTLMANLIRAGVLQSNDGKTFYLDLEKGVLRGAFSELTISGKTVNVIAGELINAQTQLDIFNKLTNNGEAQGIALEDGKLYINGQYVEFDGANIGGWDISSQAIYKDVTAPDGTVYRVYLQPPLTSAPDKTWVLSCQKSTDGGKTFHGSFVLYSDGSARFGNTTISAGGSINFGDKLYLLADGTLLWPNLSDGSDAAQIVRQADGGVSFHMDGYLNVDSLSFGKISGNDVYTGAITTRRAEDDSTVQLVFINGVLSKVIG